MTEYGIFNSEGLLEAQFYSKDEAWAAVADRYTDEDPDDLAVEEVCPDHEGQISWACEECSEEEQDEAEDEAAQHAGHDTTFHYAGAPGTGRTEFCNDCQVRFNDNIRIMSPEETR